MTSVDPSRGSTEDGPQDNSTRSGVRTPSKLSTSTLLSGALESLTFHESPPPSLAARFSQQQRAGIPTFVEHHADEAKDVGLINGQGVVDEDDTDRVALVSPMSGRYGPIY